MARGVIPIWARVIGRERKLESLEEEKRELQGKLRFPFRSRQEKDEITEKIKIVDEQIDEHKSYIAKFRGVPPADTERSI
jgi:hypothetical protein